MAEEEEYYTFNETIQRLGITEDKLLNLVTGNQLRAFRIGRNTLFRREEVDQFLAAGGAAPVSAAESRVLELDELPDDVVMLEEGDGAPAQDTQFEPLEELEEAPLEVAAAEEEPAIDIFGDDAAAEEPAELDLNEDLGTLEIPSESNPEFEETIVTDSSSLQNTEELSLDDDDSAFSTQEITIQEDAISEDEISSGETLTDETMPVEEDLDEARPAARRGAGRTGSHPALSASSSRGRRSLQIEKPGTTNLGDLIFTGVLGALVLVLLYPASLLGTLLFYGYTTGPTRDTIAPGQQTYDGKIGEISPVFLPSWYQWIRDKDMKDYFGYPVHRNNNLKGYISFEERERKGMIKLPEIKVETPKPAEDAKPAAEGEAK